MFFEYFGLFKGQKPHRNTRRPTVTRSKAAVSEAARSPTAAPPGNAVPIRGQIIFCKNCSSALPPRATACATANCQQRRSRQQNRLFRCMKRAIPTCKTTRPAQQNGSIGAANRHL